MSKRTISLAAVLCTVASMAFGQSSYIFEVPGPNGATTQIFGLGDNDFTRFLGPASVAAGSYRVLALPDRTGYYIITPTAVQFAPANLSTVTALAGITGTITSSGLTPDGKYLLIVADHFYIITTATNTVTVSDTSIPFGTVPIDLAFSPDSQTVWVLIAVNQGAQSGIVAVNPSSGQSGQTQLLPYPATAMTLSPLGLLYVVYVADKIDEINPATLSVTPSGHMNVPNGQLSGRLHFTPDGSTGYASSATACSFPNCFTAFQLNVASHTLTGVPFDGNAPVPFFDDILIASNSVIYGFSASAGATVPKLWDISPSPFTIVPTALPLGIPNNIIQSVAISDERPSPRYLYVLDSDLNRPLLRVGFADGTIVPSGASIGQAISFASIPAQAGTATSFVTLNTTQTVLPGATPAPLIATATDALGRPVFRQQVCFSANSSSGVVIANPSQITNANGVAQTAVTVPAAQGAYQVNVGLGACGSTTTSSTFTINVGTSSGPATSTQINIYTGDAQLLRRFTSATQPLTVKLTNTDGTPMAGAPVAFTITAGPGVLFNAGNATSSSSATVTTDANGLAATGFTAGDVPQGLSFTTTSVNASSSVGSLDFIETTHNANLEDPVGKPIFITNNLSAITVAEGQVIPALFTASTLSQKPPQSGVPIPNIGIRLADPTSSSLAPSAFVGCQGSSRGDAQGVSRCNVIGICQPAGTSFPVTVNALASVGEAAFYSLLVTLTQGTASKVTVKSTDPQVGSPGNTFILRGQVSDGCNLPAGNIPVTWSITGPGSLSASSTFSDQNGNVTSLVTLGNTPGAVTVQLSAGPAIAIFHLTNQIAVSSITPPQPASAVVSTAFSPLTFVVRDTNGTPVPNTTVNFTLSGTGSTGATVNATGTTNAQGQVQANVIAGPNAGTIVLTATFASLTASVTLTATLPGPQFTTSSFTNAASGTIGMTPCGLVTVRGTGFVTGVQGVVSGMNLFGPLPTTLAGVSITVQQGTNNPIQAAIREVANDSSGQRVTFQAPCQLTAASALFPGVASVTITASGASTTVNSVSVFASQPGLFTFTGSNGKQYGTVIRESDGSYITPTNLAHRGDKLYLVVTGLGQTTPASTTNSVGLGSQNANVPMLVFLNNTALNAISSRYLFGSVGAYLVEFQIPSDFPLGTDLNILPVATANNGNDFIVGNTTLFPGVTP